LYGVVANAKTRKAAMLGSHGAAHQIMAVADQATACVAAHASICGLAAASSGAVTIRCVQPNASDIRAA